MWHVVFYVERICVPAAARSTSMWGDVFHPIVGPLLQGLYRSSKFLCKVFSPTFLSSYLQTRHVSSTC